MCSLLVFYLIVLTRSVEARKFVAATMALVDVDATEGPQIWRIGRQIRRVSYVGQQQTKNVALPGNWLGRDIPLPQNTRI